MTNHTDMTTSRKSGSVSLRGCPTLNIPLPGYTYLLLDKTQIALRLQTTARWYAVLLALKLSASRPHSNSWLYDFEATVMEN